MTVDEGPSTCVLNALVWIKKAKQGNEGKLSGLCVLSAEDELSRRFDSTFI
jgi:hypothetical protein